MPRKRLPASERAPETELRISGGRTVLLTAEVVGALTSGAVLALATSGGRDSAGMAFAANEAADRLGHTGPRILVHSYLGKDIEWEDSLPAAGRLARDTGLELVVIGKDQPGLIDRWETRHANGLRRYAQMELVLGLLPWSTSQLLFCSGELKAQRIARALTAMHPGQEILNATGVRREESRNRSCTPASAENSRLRRVRLNTSGWDWCPISHWRLQDVVDSLTARGHESHYGYTLGMSRISCTLCVQGALRDSEISAWVPGHEEGIRRIALLEIRSTFGFWSDTRWAADLRPDLLTQPEQRELADAKRRAAARRAAEARIPAHLLYQRGWPLHIPTAAESRLLAETRRTVGDLLRIPVAAMQYTEADALRERYIELVALNPDPRAGKLPPPEVAVQGDLLLAA